MLKRLKGSEETLQHFCDKYGNYKNMKLGIFLHDVHPYLVDKETGKRLDGIMFCPYCGVSVDNEERP